MAACALIFTLRRIALLGPRRCHGAEAERQHYIQQKVGGAIGTRAGA